MTLMVYTRPNPIEGFDYFDISDSDKKRVSKTERFAGLGDAP